MLRRVVVGPGVKGREPSFKAFTGAARLGGPERLWKAHVMGSGKRSKRRFYHSAPMFGVSYSQLPGAGRRWKGWGGGLKVGAASPYRLPCVRPARGRRAHSV